MTAIVLADDEAGRKQALDSLLGRSHAVQQLAPSGRSVADRKPFRGRTVDPAFLEVGDRSVVTSQLFLEVPLRLGHALEQLVIAARGPLAFFPRNLNAHHARQRFHGIRKLEMIVLHQEAEGGAMRTAAEAVVKTLGRTDGKGRGFLIVKRADRLVLASRLLQLDACSQDLDDVRPGNQVVNEMLGYQSGHGSRDWRFCRLFDTGTLDGRGVPGFSWCDRS